jgi:hypothetical protein
MGRGRRRGEERMEERKGSVMDVRQEGGRDWEGRGGGSSEGGEGGGKRREWRRCIMDVRQRGRDGEGRTLGVRRGGKNGDARGRWRGEDGMKGRKRSNLEGSERKERDTLRRRQQKRRGGERRGGRGGQEKASP